MLWQKSQLCLKSFPWKTKAEWHLQLQKEQTPSRAELLPVSSEKCCSLILVQMRFRRCHCNPLVLVFAGRSVVADDDCSTQWGLRAHTPCSLPSEPCVQADWKAAGWESCVFFTIFIYFYGRHSPCASSRRIISCCSKPDIKGRMVHFIRTSPREHCSVILFFFFLSRCPLRNFLQCLFPFPAVCSCSSWLLNEGVSHAWVTSVGNFQSFVFFHILFLGHLLATYCTYPLATRTL